MEITYHPIGVIHSPFTDLKQMPIQPTGRSCAPGTVEVFAEFSEGLKDLDGFSHLILLYHFHQSRQVTLTVTPFLESAARGLFATRAPTRPNPIGISIVELVSIQANFLQIANLDILDGTPLLDIKPYVPDFDRPAAARVGWLEEARHNLKSTHSDGRFVSG